MFTLSFVFLFIVLCCGHETKLAIPIVGVWVTRYFTLWVAFEDFACLLMVSLEEKRKNVTHIFVIICNYMLFIISFGCFYDYWLILVIPIITLWFNFFLSFHQKKSYHFSPPHILSIIKFNYISITFSHLKFASGLLH